MQYEINCIKSFDFIVHIGDMQKKDDKKYKIKRE